MNTTRTSLDVRQRLWVIVRFVLFGCVGFWVLLFGSAHLISRFISEGDHFAISPFFSVPVVLAGTAMMLYGTGEWGHWGYALVFLSIPVSLLLLVLIPGLGGDKVLPALIAGVAAFATYAGVRAYYARGPLGDEDPG
jgi:hypothetical protein